MARHRSTSARWSTVTSTPWPAMLASVWRTSSIFTPGKMRQFTLATALCGKAFWACPPSSMVATQVVRVWPTYDGLAASAAAAASSFGLAANFAMAWPSSPGVVLLDARKPAMVVSFHMTGKLNSRSFTSATARS